MSEKWKHFNKRKKQYSIIAVTGIIVILSVLLVFLIYSDKKSIEPVTNTVKTTNSTTIVPKPTEEPTTTMDFSELKGINSEVFAYINIPGTNIDYPILQSATEDDAYYLNHTIEKKEGLPGTIYTEKYNSKEFTDPVTVVYGHNMKNGSMFADLHKYEDKAFFDSNPYIYIYLPDKAIKYRVFSATPFDDRYILGSYSFVSPTDFQEYLDELRSGISGNVNADVNVSQGTGILTLSTCIADSANERLLINATREE